MTFLVNWLLDRR